MQKQVSSHPQGQRKSIPGAQRAINQPKKAKPTRVIRMEIRISLHKTLLLLILIPNNFRPRLLKKNKDKRHQKNGRDHPASRVNATKVIKKNKNKTKDLSHIECYTCKQKGHHTNKCPKKLQNYWRS